MARQSPPAGHLAAIATRAAEMGDWLRLLHGRLSIKSFAAEPGVGNGQKV
jgi:hypothetical protein